MINAIPFIFLTLIIPTLESIPCGADLGGFVLAGYTARAFWFFGPVSLQVRPDDGVQRHRPPHAWAQLVGSGLSSCQFRRDIFLLFIKSLKIIHTNRFFLRKLAALQWQTLILNALHHFHLHIRKPHM